MDNYNMQGNPPPGGQWPAGPYWGQNVPNTQHPNAGSGFIPMPMGPYNLMAPQQAGPSTAPIQGAQSFGMARISGPPRPPMQELVKSSTGTYRGWIRSLDEYSDAKREYLSIQNRQPGNHSDIPTTDEEYRRLIKVLFDAMHETTETIEPSDSQNVTRVQEGSYSDVEYEIVLWPLLV